MSKIEFVSPEGLRIDGRRAGELRKLSPTLGYFPNADGSSSLQQGNTKVVVSVFGPHECRRRGQAAHDRAVVNVQYNVANFSKSERKQFNKNDRQIKDFSALLRQTFESIILTELYPRSEIDICVQVLQSDGGVNAACINATTLALIDAGIPLLDLACACTAGFLDKVAVVDLNYSERAARGGELLVVVLPTSSRVVSLEIEGGKLATEGIETLLELAQRGCGRTHEALVAAVAAHADAALAARGKISYLSYCSACSEMPHPRCT